MSSRTQTVPAAWGWLGIKLVATEEGSATVEMQLTEDMANHAGFVHGGMISALAESAMGRSVGTLKPPVALAIGFDLKLSFISPASVGEKLGATGRVIYAGRRTAVTACRVEGPGGKLVATASGTFVITRNKE